VNRPSEMKRFIRAGVRGIFTDFPQILAGLRQEQQRFLPERLPQS
jgi:hypothetical protein